MSEQLIAESAAPARPLEAVLADIRAEGYHVQLSIHADGHAYLSTWAGEKATDEAADWMHDNGDDPVRLAEARLADIRKLHAEQAANPLASLNLTPDQVRENIERALARQDPAAAVEAVQRDADADAEAVLEQGEALVRYYADESEADPNVYVVVDTANGAIVSTHGASWRARDEAARLNERAPGQPDSEPREDA